MKLCTLLLRVTRLATLPSLLLGFTGISARADMVLTSTALDQGLTLSTFASGFPFNGGGVGPLGVAFLPTGGVLVSDYPGNVRLFASDSNGQNASGAPVSQNFGYANAVDIAQVGGKIYMTQQGAGTLVQINPDGTLNHVIATGMPSATGMIADPTTGHLFVSTVGSNVIYNVDPIAMTKTVFVQASADGLALSADASTLYGEVYGHILAWNTRTGTQVFDSGAIPGSPDGTAIGAGRFAGDLFVNTNGGQLYEINQTTLAQTLLGDGGSRGDFVTVDPTNDTLLLTQTDRLLRLSGASFQPTPEPASWALFGCGIAGVTMLRKIRKAQ